MKKRIIMGLRYVEQGLQWLAGKGFAKVAGKLFFKSEAKFYKNFSIPDSILITISVISCVIAVILAEMESYLCLLSVLFIAIPVIYGYDIAAKKVGRNEK